MRNFVFSLSDFVGWLLCRESQRTLLNDAKIILLKNTTKKMKIGANSPEAYINQLPEERKQAMTKLRKTILDHIPKGFDEVMIYGMIGYVVPHSIYPDGYHCDTTLPLPFINIASQKNFIALYHSGIYANPALKEWFEKEYPKHSKIKLDMGKSCIRFKKIDQIPYELITQLVKKMDTKEWIEIYEQNTKKK